MTLIAKFQTVVLAAVLLRPTPLAATTAVVVVTEQGIVMATDSKTTVRVADFSTFGELTTRKLVLVQGRIVIACIGVSDFRTANSHHNFLTWMQSLQLKLPDNVSVEEFTRIIEKESARVFSTFDTFSKDGSLKKQESDETCKTFVQYLIAGYQAGTPLLYEVRSYIDWNYESLVGPARILLDPDREIPEISTSMYSE